MDMNSPTIIESLQISALGICVVFIVLIILMIVVYIMSAILKTFSGNPETASVEAPAIPIEPVTTPEPLPSPEPPPALEPPPAPEPAPVPEPAPSFAITEPVLLSPTHFGRVPVKYKVTVNGTTYDVVDGQVEATEGQADDN